MPIKFTRPRFVSTREIPAPSDPWDAFKGKRRSVPAGVFRGRPVTPQKHLGVENRTSSVGRGSVPTNVRRRIEPPRTRRQESDAE